MTDNSIALLVGLGSATVSMVGVAIPLVLKFLAGQAEMKRDMELARIERNHFGQKQLAELGVNTQLTRENGVKADAAYKEANDVNAKILSLKQGNKDTLGRIEETGGDTNTVVHDLQGTKP